MLSRNMKRCWNPGERVRFYRTSSSNFVWLPGEAEEAPVNTDWEAEKEDTPAGGEDINISASVPP